MNAITPRTTMGAAILRPGAFRLVARGGLVGGRGWIGHPLSPLPINPPSRMRPYRRLIRSTSTTVLQTLVCVVAAVHARRRHHVGNACASWRAYARSSWAPRARSSSAAARTRSARWRRPR